MKEIKLTRGMVALVDDSDYEHLSGFSWQAVDNHGTFYARTAKKINGRVYHTYMHRMIMDCPKELEIDHIDRNPLNNQRANLRIVKHSENMQNLRPREKSTKCSKCGTERDKLWLPYCRTCFNEYQRNRRNTDESRERERLYKREYRERMKLGA